MEAEKVSVKWTDFQENVQTAFGQLRVEGDLSDVTLVCADGKEIEAHKVILSTSSPFFMDIFKRNKHSHPLIYMKGMKGNELTAVIDFIYYGEAKVSEDKLQDFFATADELNLKGLDRENAEKVPPVYQLQLATKVSCEISKVSKVNHEQKPSPNSATTTLAIHGSHLEIKNENHMENINNISTQIFMKQTKTTPVVKANHDPKPNQVAPYDIYPSQPQSTANVKVKTKERTTNNDKHMDMMNTISNQMFMELSKPTSVVDVKANKRTMSTLSAKYLDDLKQAIDMMMEKKDGNWTCVVCGKKSGKEALKIHVKSMHIDSENRPCKKCSKVFKSRMALANHIVIAH